MYAQIEDLENRLGLKTLIELTNANKRAESVNEKVATAFLMDGKALVDSYIGQRVNLPLDIVPHFVKTLTLDIAIYYLHNKVGVSNNKESTVQKLYDDAIKHLERFAKGETSLGLTIIDKKNESDNTAHSSSNTAEIISESRRCSRTTFANLT